MNCAFFKKGKHSLPSYATKILSFPILFFLLGRNAYAYIDPGSGEYILQLILAALGGVFFFAVRFWSRIRILLFHRNVHGESRVQR